jgi:hypothetical protein
MIKKILLISFLLLMTAGMVVMAEETNQFDQDLNTLDNITFIPYEEPFINETVEAGVERVNGTIIPINETIAANGTNETTPPVITPPVISPPIEGITYPSVEQYMTMRRFATPTGPNADRILAGYAEQAKTRCLKDYGNRTFLASVGVIVTSHQEGDKTVYGREYICFFPGNGHHTSTETSNAGSSSSDESNGILPCYYEDKQVCVNKEVCAKPVCQWVKGECDKWKCHKCIKWDYNKICAQPVCHEEETCHAEQVRICPA